MTTRCGGTAGAEGAIAMAFTELLENAPRVLIHARGVMTPEETGFWERVRFALRDRGFELLLTAHQWAQTPADVPILRARNGLESVPPPDPQTGWDAWLPLPSDVDETPFLERERMWNGPETSPVMLDQRRRAIHFFWTFYAVALARCQPVLTVIWNGHHPQEMIMGELCRRSGCPVLYLERGPFPGTIHLDAGGVLGGSAIAKAPSWQWPETENPAHWHEVMARAETVYRANRETWWTQPASPGPKKLRKQLGTEPGVRVILFAGQVDKDVQNLLYAPNFGTNLAAFRWFCEHLPEHAPLRILGKHHPKSDTPPEAYRMPLGDRGRWLKDLSLEDCWAVADRVAAVNSTVLYEALMMGKPALCLGDSLLSGKGIAYEVRDPAAGREVVAAWLEARDFEERAERWRDFGAYLLATQLYTMKPPETAGGQRDAAALAVMLSSRVAAHGTVSYGPLTPGRALLDEVGLWDEHRGRFKEHDGFKEVLRGLNIALRASLGRAAPSLYTRLLRLANALYNGMTGRQRSPGDPSP